MVGKAFKTFLHFAGELARVIYMHAHEERVIFLEHPAKLRSDALRKENGDSRTDPQELDVLDAAKTAQDLF